MKSNSNLIIRGSKNSESHIPDLKKIHVSSFEECIKYLQIGLNVKEILIKFFLIDIQ